MITNYNDLYFPSYYLLLKQEIDGSRTEWHIYDPHNYCSVERISAGLAKDMVDDKRVVFFIKDINLKRTYYTKKDDLSHTSFRV